MGSILIKNYLQVIGRRVKVPGFEPLSEQTTNNLSIAMQSSNTYIDLDLALKLIPGSRVIIAHAHGGPTSGSFGHDKWFELPDGPPPNGSTCPCTVIEDYYKILQDAARVSGFASSSDPISCDRHDFSPNSCDFEGDFRSGLS